MIITWTYKNVILTIKNTSTRTCICYLTVKTLQMLLVRRYVHDCTLGGFAHTGGASVVKNRK